MANSVLLVLWITFNAIWVYNLTVHSGHFEVLRRAFSSVSEDSRCRPSLIAFSFGALLEALAGGGSPVAICSVMLIALGVNPLKAAALTLVADTARSRSAASATRSPRSARSAACRWSSSARWPAGRCRSWPCSCRSC